MKDQRLIIHKLVLELATQFYNNNLVLYYEKLVLKCVC